MKKTLTILAVAVAMLVTANAQTGINIAYTPQTINSTNGNLHDTIRLDGIAIGINQNIALSGDLALSVGLQGRYGFASSETTVNLGILGSATATAAHKQLLIDVPVLLNYGFNLGSNVRLTLFAGPTVSFVAPFLTNLILLFMIGPFNMFTAPAFAPNVSVWFCFTWT